MSDSLDSQKAFPRFFDSYIQPLLSKSVTHILAGILILAFDLFTGRYLTFPVLFVLPVAFAGWYCSARLAYALAVILPTGRLLIVLADQSQYPPLYVIANAFTRMAVLVFIAYLVVRTARQTKELQARVESLVTICAWSRTVKYEGEWISFEQYLLRRFKINTSHGISPDEAKKIFSELENQKRVG